MMKENDKNSGTNIPYLPVGMCLGLSVGLAIGSAMGNIGVGMCLGMGIGLCFGSALDAANNKKRDGDSSSEETPEEQ